METSFKLGKSISWEIWHSCYTSLYSSLYNSLCDTLYTNFVSKPQPFRAISESLENSLRITLHKDKLGGE